MSLCPSLSQLFLEPHRDIQKPRFYKDSKASTVILKQFCCFFISLRLSEQNMKCLQIRMHILMWKQNICIGYHRWGVPSTKKDFEIFYPKGCNNRREKNPLNYQMNSCVLLFCAQCTQEFASSFFLSWLPAHPI